MIRMRVQYMKTGAIRYTSHLDTVRMFQRGFSACGIPVSYSQGYHPHPRMSFSPPLKTGWEGLEECFDCYLDSVVEDIGELCNTHLPDGLRITGNAIVAAKLPKLPVSISGARFIVRINTIAIIDSRETVGDSDETGDPAAQAGGRNAEPALEDAGLLRLFERSSAAAPGREPVLLDAAFSHEDDNFVLEYTCTMQGGKYLSPERVSREALALPELNGRTMRVVRTKLFVRQQNDLVSPLDEEERPETSERN